MERPGSQFKLNRFYKDIAVGTGTGFRFDFKFIIARVDVGMKLRDPLQTSGEISGPDTESGTRVEMDIHEWSLQA